MDSLSLKVKDNRDIFVPGGVIEGEAAWQLGAAPKKIYLRLFWYTRGKGTEDVDVVDETVFDHPQASDTRPFKIPLPKSPYSFSGQLVSLTWALELSGKGTDVVATKEFIMSPFGYNIDLTGNTKETA